MTDEKLVHYLDRIGLDTASATDPAGLAQWLAAHRQAIPFENLDIPLGHGIAIDGPSVFAKQVKRQRGGYCFEQNRLLGDMLALSGLATRPLLARVLLGVPEGQVPPRTHVLLLAQVAGQDCIIDGGFGGSLVPPLPLVDGASAATPDGAVHRLRHVVDARGEWLLERAGAAAGSDWQAQYAFNLAPVAQQDLEQCNHWTATRPGERFTTFHVVSRVLPDGFASLTDRQLTIHRNGESQQRIVADAGAYARVLDEVFGLVLPAADLARLPLFADPSA